MRASKPQQLYFILGIASFCFFYFVFEIFYNHYTMLAVDEFWFAHRIYQYKDGLPYRDFAPYKTILGYYLLLLPMLSTHSVMQTLIFTKNFIALLNTLLLFASSLWLSRFFSRAGILISLIFIVSSEIVLSYTTQIRVDLLGYWFCFVSLLFLLEKRFLFAGILIALGFATTQKAIWYILASNAALVMHGLMADRHFKTVKHILLFNFTWAIVIIGYLIFWSWISDWNTVLNSIFYEASAMYQLDWYSATRTVFWKTIILYNPLLFLLWPVTLISALVTYDHDVSYHNRTFIVTYALVILLCLIPFKQVFPYYMQVTVPILFALYAAFATWLFELFSVKEKLKFAIGKINLWSMLICYLLAFSWLMIKLQLPTPYLLICLIPIMLITYLTNNTFLQKKIAPLFLRLITITAVFTGLIYPYLLLPAKMIYLNGAYQQANIQAINALLSDGSDYIAGIELIYNKNQSIPGLRHLMGPAIDYLYAPTAKLKPVMLASLYEDPNATIESILAALTHSSVKFYVNNYRMMELPPQLKSFLHSQYTHWWGSIYLYSPEILQGKQTITLKFSSNYLIESSQTNKITLNGKHYANHTILYLNKGNYLSNAAGDYRLQLIPENVPSALDSKFKHDDWEKIIF